MKYAFIDSNLIDLWAQPKFNSERVNQALLGEIVELGSTHAGFVRVKKSDGYRGWADSRFLTPISQRKTVDYRKSRMVTVISPVTSLFDADKRAIPPHKIYYGTRLKFRSIRGVIARVETPDGRIFSLRYRDISKGNHTGSASEIIREAKKMLGTPYLWGGITSTGIDCSGLVQTIFARFGIALPRDTKDQIRVGKAVARTDIKKGDLVFFDRHVGIAIDRATIIHASVGSGGVRINRIEPGDKSYRDDLDRTLKTVRRVL